jgi:hypothetical protein
LDSSRFPCNTYGSGKPGNGYRGSGHRCGYGLARRLNAEGYTCEVVAPARSPIDQRIKTDRRDALLLARESRAGNLVAVVMPDERDEALHDLSRTREDVLAARLRAHQQMKALPLRHGRTCPGRIIWSAAHERTLSAIHLPHPAQEIAFVEYRNAIKDAHERLERITEALRLRSSQWRTRPLVQALMCLRGFDFIAAVTFVAEIGDPRRFARPTATPGSSCRTTKAPIVELDNVDLLRPSSMEQGGNRRVSPVDTPPDAVHPPPSSLVTAAAESIASKIGSSPNRAAESAVTLSGSTAAGALSTIPTLVTFEADA